MGLYFLVLISWDVFLDKEDFSMTRFPRFDNFPSTICIGINSYFLGFYTIVIFRIFDVRYHLGTSNTRWIKVVWSGWIKFIWCGITDSMISLPSDITCSFALIWCASSFFPFWEFTPKLQPYSNWIILRFVGQPEKLFFY